MQGTVDTELVFGQYHPSATHSMCRGVVCFATVVGGSLHAQCVRCPPTSQAVRCDYCAHVRRDDDAQTISVRQL